MEVTVKELQKILLEMLSNFHEFCEVNEITYYLVGGTLLGAKRHNGFIPWDDDVDIAIPRPDYERLLSMEKSLGDRGLKAVTYKSSKEHLFPYMKILNKEEKIVSIVDKSFSSEGIINRIHFDVYPLDGVGNSRLTGEMISKSVAVLKKIMSLNLDRECNSKNWMKRFIKKGIWKMNLAHIFGVMDFFMSLKKFNKSRFVTRWRDLDSSKYMVHKDIFGKPCLYGFENIRCYIPERADEYLRGVYGNYLVMPEKSKRHPTHGIEGTALTKYYEKEISEIKYGER